MVKRVSNLNQIFVILVLVVSVWNIELQQVEGAKPCTMHLGACGPAGDCVKRCKAAHVDGLGSCDLGLCTCVHSCS
ncbi:unnamed protein product [Lathyrus sativus]|nr:unnamed protein product [Lathyrus sativus]